MASNLFTRAKAYVKAHPRTSYQEAIKLLSVKDKKVSGVGKKWRIVVIDYKTWGLSKMEHIVTAPTAEDARQKFRKAHNIPSTEVIVNPAARAVGKAKPAGISTRSKSHTDKNKITANIQIGKVKAFKMGDIHADLMNKYKQAIFSVSRINDDIAFMQFDIKQDPAKRKTLAPKIRTAKKQLTEARAIMTKIRRAINS
jgi:hypothetical protein